jgi:hypothetical protein
MLFVSHIHCVCVDAGMLSWFVDEATAQHVLQSANVVSEEDVECRPDFTPTAVLDSTVDNGMIRRFFSADAWLALLAVIQLKEGTIVWQCEACSATLSDSSICCDSCLKWFDFACVGLKRRPKATEWFCRACYAASGPN